MEVRGDLNGGIERRNKMAEDKYADAMIELNDFLEGIKEDDILTREDVLKEVENVFG